MHRGKTASIKLGLIFSFVILLALIVAPPPANAQGSTSGTVSGRILDPQGQPIQNARVALTLSQTDQTTIETETNHDGVFLIDFNSDKLAKIQLKVSHPHFETLEWESNPEQIELINTGSALRIPDVELNRRLTVGFWVATLVFIGVISLIITEKLHSTISALLGAGLLLLISLVGGAFGEQLYIFDFEQAISYVDFNVIFLVLGMMIIVGTIERTGIFQWIAYHSYRISRGKLWLLAVILMLFTSVASALLDNVTTMLLVAPISIQIALTLGVNPLSLLIPEILASNVGGIATLIGTPNNILIGSYAGLEFNDFLRDLTPGVLLLQVLLTVYVLLVFRSEYQLSPKTRSQDLLDLLKENARITEPETLRKAGIVFVGTLVLFAVGEKFHLVPAVTAMIGAAVTLMVVNADVDEVLRVVDWATLLFFIALFMIVGAIQEVGLISLIADGIHALVGGDMLKAVLVVVWGTGLLCLLVPTIPLTAALLPVVGFLTQSIPGSGNMLYYSLSLGSALGANNSLVGATNNLVTAGISKRAGYPISYRQFLKYGLPLALLTMAVGVGYILIRF